MTATSATEGKRAGLSTTLMRLSLNIPSNALVLEAVHDFEARSPDELTLRKGEEVEVLEQDDEFGDGWFLGRKSTGEQGLFPKVYTTATSSSTVMPAAQQAPSTPSSPPQELNRTTASSETTSQQSEASRRSSSSDTHLSVGAHTPDATHSIPTSPLSVEKASGCSTPTRNSASTERSPPPDGFFGDRTPSYLQGLRSPVEDTLSDIEEAISEISNRQSRANKIIRDHNRRHSSVPTTPTQAEMHHHPPPTEINDSGSEYSDQDDDIVQDFGSDIDDEDDELPIQVYDEDDIPYTKDDVMRWTPEDVSQYFQGRNIAPSICTKFLKEDVSGAVLLELEISHLKELDIGSFGKRFEVWKEISHLTKNLKPPQTKPRSGSDAPRLSTLSFASDGHRRPRSNTVGAVLPRIRSQHNRPVSRPIDIEEASLHRTRTDEQPLPTSTTISSDVSSPMFGAFERPRSPPLSPTRQRPHSPTQRRSFHDSSPATALNTALSTSAAVLAGAGHHREGSFDRNWSSSAMAPPPRPSTATGVRDPRRTKHKVTPSFDTVDSGFSGSQPPTPNERSYFSSGETTRERKVLQKKGGEHQRHSGYTDETRLRSATAHSQHSPISSAGHHSSSALSAAAAFVNGGKDKHRRKTSSFSGEHEESPLPPVREAELQRRATDETPLAHGLSPTDLAMLPFSKGNRLSMSGSIGSTFVPTPESVGALSLRSADGSTPSSAICADSTKAPERPPKTSCAHQLAGKRLRRMSSGSGLRQKSKKQTSALEKGVRNITPLEAAKAADYSGWMKKRGSTGVGAWKSRLFVLNGRRLSYFYSENDTRERGLIDITSHNVLPCTDDRIVGIHAAIAAVASPVSSPKPSNSPLYQSLSSPQSPEVPSPKEKDNKEGKEKKKEKEKHEGWFVFKLVPPAPGAAKGVTFTPPRLHYLATDTREEGKKWMASLMKATIDRDETKPVVTSYNAKTISLAKARELRTRPPELSKPDGDGTASGLAICGVELGARDGDDADAEDSRERAGDRESKSTIQTDPELPQYEEKASLKGSTILADSPSERGGAVDSKSDDLKAAGEGITQVQAFGVVG